MSDSLRPHGLTPTRLLWPRGFSRQEYWGGLPFPSPGCLPNPRITLQADSLPLSTAQVQPLVEALRCRMSHSAAKPTETQTFPDSSWEAQVFRTQLPVFLAWRSATNSVLTTTWSQCIGFAVWQVRVPKFTSVMILCMKLKKSHLFNFKPCDSEVPKLQGRVRKKLISYIVCFLLD